MTDDPSEAGPRVGASRGLGRRVRNWALEMVLGAFLAGLIFYVLGISFVQLKFVYAGF